MKKTIIVIWVLFMGLKYSNAQLVGKGNLISKTYNFKNFDKLNIEDFDGSIEIEIGKPYSIVVEIDENLENRLLVNKNIAENQLNVILDGNKNGKLYLENTRIKIKINMPEVSVIHHRGNTNMVINGIFGRYFMLQNEGNGNVYLSGQIDELEIKKTGNGEVKANKLIAKIANVKSFGNGNVVVNAQLSLTANGVGNSSILQVGHGKIDLLSGIVGNGEVRKI